MGTDGMLTKGLGRVQFQWSSRCCHILNSRDDMLITLRLAVFSDMLTVISSSPHSDHTRCLDTHHSSYSTSHHHNSNMPRETHGNNCNLTTTTHTETAYSLQCYFSSFLPSTQIWNPSSECQHITRYGKPSSSEHHHSTLLHLATHGKQSQWNSTPTPCDHTINTSKQSLSTPPKQLPMTDTFQYEAIRRYEYSMELVHPPRIICFSFGIAYTSWNRIILLLFLLVPTCQISKLTFTIR